MEAQAFNLEVSESNYSKALANLVVSFLKQRTYPVGIIYGNPNSGKSDTACLVAEIGLKERVIDCFASNIDTGGVGQKITSLEDVRFWHRNQYGAKLFIEDEAGNNDGNRSPMSKLNVETRKEIFIARKFKVHWLFILPELKDIDNWKDSNLTGLLIKKSAWGEGHDRKYTATIWMRGQPELIPVNNFPRTVIPFDTLDVAEFTLERQNTDETLKLRGLTNHVADLYANGQNFSQIAAKLTEETGQKWRNQEVIRELKKFLKQTLHYQQEHNQTSEKPVVVQHESGEEVILPSGCD